MEDFSGTELWKNILGAVHADSLRLRCAVAPKDIASYVIAQKQDVQYGCTLIDLANDFVHAALDREEQSMHPASIESLRKAALAFGGYLVVLEKTEPLPAPISPLGVSSRDIGSDEKVEGVLGSTQHSQPGHLLAGNLLILSDCYPDTSWMGE